MACKECERLKRALRRLKRKMGKNCGGPMCSIYLTELFDVIEEALHPQQQEPCKTTCDSCDQASQENCAEWPNCGPECQQDKEPYEIDKQLAMGDAIISKALEEDKEPKNKGR